MKHSPLRPERTPIQKARIGFAISVVGIAIGLFCMIPVHETFGNVWTMISGIIAGIYYARMSQLKKK